MEDTIFKERYKKLNKNQKKAVDAIEGPVLVVAGPGSGKTEILSLRVANILRETDIAPSNILCLTFTDSASNNMRERLSEIIGRDAYRVAIHTFHSFGVEIIDKNPEFFYNGANFIPADNLAQLEIVESVLKDLDHDNPLGSVHPEQGFVYSNAIIQSIGHLKKAGLTPEEFKAILDHNKEEIEFADPLLAEIFDERLSKSSFKNIAGLISKLEKNNSKPFPVSHFTPWLPNMIYSLKRVLEEAEQEEKATPLSLWKTKYTKKDDNGKRVHRDYLNLEKMYALAFVYEKYKNEMYLRGYYDFDDMLLEAIQALQKKDRLRYDLQEQFQYVLVDEFQDTNDAQIRLLHLITDAGVNEGRPNIMAVGDDDQAIYKFQGAEISNILSFKGSYRDPEVITMTENYRSTQDILDVARHIIKKGEERLENIIPEMKKELVSSNPNIKEGNIINKIFPTSAHEFNFIAGEIKRLIDEGKEPNEISVISRTHKKLEEIVVYLNEQKIPVNYERQKDVLKEPHIHQLVVMGKFVVSLARKKTEDADMLLPEILSYPFWNLSREMVWKIAIEAERSPEGRKKWLSVMRNSKDEKISQIAGFFDELAGKAQTETLEMVFDTMVGEHQNLVEDEDDDDISSDESLESAENKKQKTRKSYISPFREYYFNSDKFENNKTEYLTFLSSLRVFVHTLREYKNGEQLKLDDMVEFVNLHEKNKLQITDKSSFTNAGKAVNLMTAHKAKGLEFDTVFVISCQNEVWADSSRGSKITFPENLVITPAGDNFDDQLKLFYVALTRAKSNLYLTSYTHTDTGKESTKLQFLDVYETETKNKKVQKFLQGENQEGGDLPKEIEVLAHSWDMFYKTSFKGDEEALLRTLLDNYQMPVTHLNNFLNVSHGGPQTFLEQNLLRFPQSKIPSAAYGSCMHKAVELLYINLRKDGFIPGLEQVLGWFEKELKMKRLSDEDYKLFLKRGFDALAIYYKERMSTFNPTDKIEVNFKNQGVLIGEANITGRIDKMVDVGAGELEVVDFKTGKASEKWEGKTPHEKIKLHNYKRQIIFYKLLVENSRDFMQKGIVKTGHLEFLEPKNGKIIDLSLLIEDKEVERTIRLIEVVYNKIMNLDFPDVSEYSQDLKGTLAFEESLLGLK